MSMMVGRGADVPETVNLQKTSAGDKSRETRPGSQVKSSQVKSSPGISHERSRNLPRAPPPLPQVLTGSYDPLDIKGTTENVYRVVASYWASGIPCTARARRAVVASMDPMQRAARHAMPMAGTTALQDLLAEVAGRRREAHDTAARIRDLARARRAAVLAARVMGGAWTTHVRRVTLLLAGETAPRRARVRAAAAAAAANSGPTGTTSIGLR